MDFSISGRAQAQTPEIQSVMAEPQKLNVGYVIFIIAAAAIFALLMGATILCLGRFLLYFDCKIDSVTNNFAYCSIISSSRLLHL